MATSAAMGTTPQLQVSPISNRGHVCLALEGAVSVSVVGWYVPGGARVRSRAGTGGVRRQLAFLWHRGYQLTRRMWFLFLFVSLLKYGVSFRSILADAAGRKVTGEGVSFIV